VTGLVVSDVGVSLRVGIAVFGVPLAVTLVAIVSGAFGGVGLHPASSTKIAIPAINLQDRNLNGKEISVYIRFANIPFVLPASNHA
jgi:Na+/H+ antiporter NhaC